MIRWVILGVIFYLSVLVVKLPAQFAFSFIELPKKAQVTGVDGTIWAGEIGSASYQGQTLEKIRWKLHPLALLTGKLELELEAGDRRSAIQLSGTLGYGSSGAYGEGVLFEFPAALIKEFYPVPATLQGQLKGVVQEISQGQPWCNSVVGRITWTNPVIYSKLIKQELALDTTRAQLGCDNGNLVATVTDDGKVLGLNAQATLMASEYLVTGELKPGRDFPEEFKQGLGFVASPMSGGRYKLDMDGHFK